MSLTFDQMIHPDKHGLIVCSHCNGYGSSLKEELIAALFAAVQD